MKNNQSVCSLEEFMRELKKLQRSNEIIDSEVIFRGHTNSSWELKPKIARTLSLNQEQIKHFEEIENQFIDDFKRWLPNYNFDFSNDIIKTLCLGQHYGLYTRLLDWTQNPLTALWFSLNKKEIDSREDSVVWLLFYDKHDVQKYRSDFKLNTLKRTKVLFPPFTDKRIVSQSSVFTIHKLTENGQFISLENNSIFKSKLKKIIINNDSIPEIKNELSQIITKQMLFQDMSALCDDINNRNELGLFLLNL